MKIILIGGVASSLMALRKLHEHNFRDVTVFGYRPSDTANVSGWLNLEVPARDYGYAYHPFLKINDCAELISEIMPDLIFVVGLSQLISKKIIDVPRLGCVGFHPTALPRGRGRAPIAWLVLLRESGAATFFNLQAGTDDGAIYVQEPFEVDEKDDASSVEVKILTAEEKALDTWLPALKSGRLHGLEQNHRQATYYGRRAPEDGVIDWSSSAIAIDRLIKASSRPHPGAFTYQADSVIRIWRSKVDSVLEYVGVTGRILSINSDECFLVQCGERLLLITEWTAETAWRPRVGMKLGYYPEEEIHNLRLKCHQLTNRIEKLEIKIEQLCGNDD